MKLHILSDLHLEFGKWPKGIDVNAIDADVTVLAGDIGVGLEGLQWALTINRPVIYVMGNHEFYGQRPMNELWRKAREKVDGTQVHLLENESLVIDDPHHSGERVRFLCATLWTDFAILGDDRQRECMDAAGREMTDYQVIYVSRRGHSLAEPGFTTSHQGDRLTPRKTYSLHEESRSFLEQELARLPPMENVAEFWRKTVVVTHHAPSSLSLTDQQPVAPLDAAFASALDPLIGKADLWIHGHTHVWTDYRVGSGRVVSNPRGYSGHEAVTEFTPTFVIDV
ncbi:MAG: metallophosphoesterase family protein [Sterolibacteriaceae bacterium MAG5]|nr:metallophosphoesterase family protein [Candidatus Nitricoxidireducens bremensis]